MNYLYFRKSRQIFVLFGKSPSTTMNIPYITCKGVSDKWHIPFYFFQVKTFNISQLCITKWWGYELGTLYADMAPLSLRRCDFIFILQPQLQIIRNRGMVRPLVLPHSNPNKGVRVTVCYANPGHIFSSSNPLRPSTGNLVPSQIVVGIFNRGWFSDLFGTSVLIFFRLLPTKITTSSYYTANTFFMYYKTLTKPFLI